MGTITQTYKRISDDPEYHADERPAIRAKDVGFWFDHIYLTLKPKYYHRRDFISLVAPGPKHTIQVALFIFKHEQEKP